MLRFSRNVGLSGAMICYITWTFCNADVMKISGTAGGTVTLNCIASISNLSLLTWELNGELLFVFTTLDNGDLFETSAASRLNLKLNLNRSDIQLYALVIEKANESHSGKYTCETTTGQGISKHTWELLITEKPKNLHIYIYVICVAVPVCVLLIIVCVFILRRSSKQKPKKIIRSLRLKKDWSEVSFYAVDIIAAKPGDFITCEAGIGVGNNYTFKWTIEQTAAFIKLLGDDDHLFTGAKYSAAVA